MSPRAQQVTSYSILAAAIAGLIGGAIVSLTQTNNITVNVQLPPAAEPDAGVTPPEFRFGLAEGFKAKAEEAFAEYPQAFRVAGEIDRTANARLWGPVLAVNGGEHFANVPQQTGDCVSWGLKNAIRYRLAYQRWQGQSATGGDAFAPYLYGLARVTIGKGSPPCRSAGAYPSYAIQGYKRHGWITTDEAGSAYSGRLANEWGCQGPPRNMLALGEARSDGDAYPIRSADELIEAITNGYPCTIASMFGTRTIRAQDGRQVATWNDRWPHQMCFVGYDGSGRTPYVYALNSWGADAHPRPLGDEPPGGFWVTLDTAARMIADGECWAISDVAGFPNDGGLDWSIFDDVLRQAAVSVPEGRAILSLKGR